MNDYDELQHRIQSAISHGDAAQIEHLAAKMLEINDLRAESRATFALGVMHHLRGHYNESLAAFDASLGLFKKAGDKDSCAGVHGNVANIHYSVGEYADALSHYDQALQIYEELGNEDGIAKVDVGKASTYHACANYPLAAEHFHRALAHHTSKGNSIALAGVESNIANVYSSTGEYETALKFLDRALKTYEAADVKAGIAFVVGNMASVLTTQGLLGEAAHLLRRAVNLYQEIGDEAHLALVSTNLVSVLIRLGDTNQAGSILGTLEHHSINNPRVIAGCLGNRAHLHRLANQLDEAEALLKQALELSLSTGTRQDALEFHQQLRDLAQLRNDFPSYIVHNNACSTIAEEISGKAATQRMAMMEAERKMEGERQERERERALLYGTLPKSIADRMIRGEKITGDHYDNASVIFLDIVGFTSISDRIPSGHVVHLLEQIFTTLDAVCEKHNVVKIKTIGDSYMAVSFESVVNAATCTLEMTTSLDELEITMATERGDTSWIKDVGEIQVRIGIHCGPITAGVIGTERLQYDVWGDTVNVASRMESTSEPGRIHVSETFALAVQQTITDAPFSIVERGTVEIKGKGMMTTYWLDLRE